MAYHIACIRDSKIEKKLSTKIKVASFCRKLSKDDEFLTLIEEIKRKISALSRYSIIKLMDVLC